MSDATNTYRIVRKNGTDYGTYQAVDVLEALHALALDSGFKGWSQMCSLGCGPTSDPSDWTTSRQDWENGVVRVLVEKI